MNTYTCKSCRSAMFFSPGAVPLIIHTPDCPVRMQREQHDLERESQERENRERYLRLTEAAQGSSKYL